MTSRFKPTFYGSDYKAPKLDARINEARAMLTVRQTVNDLLSSTLSASFSLRPATAVKLIEKEILRRG